uniref:Branched-chain-amino-acid transaminase n=1 Tax=Hemiselmis andersenii TaxID=464988 RepID=A0A6U4HXF8_HEMAN|mmetsp:Transcript_13330/g.30863  ORF Transcript_13330/g.30863 Transcript_13330/m.30863 type:complete len:421 (+) Transcript_13330:44-1306(+)
MVSTLCKPLLGMLLITLLAVPSAAFAPSLLSPSRLAKSGLRRTAASPAAVRRLPPAIASLRSVLDATKEDHAPTAMDWEELGSKPWGSIETDFMSVCKCESDGKWTKAEIVPYGPLPVSPRAAVLNYGQGIFEGMKAQRTKDGKIVLFRPEKNSARTQYGCERLCMPPVPQDIFLDAVKSAVLANAKWVPPHGQGSLYLRPLIIGTGPILGLAPAPSYTFLVYVSPVGSYFKGSQMTPIKLKVEDEFVRAAAGGAGGIKAVGNYAPTLQPQAKAKAEGFDNVLYLDAKEGKYLEEVGTSNVFVVKGKTIHTPGLKGGGNPEDTILEGVTRDSVIQVCKDAGYEVIEDRVEREMLWNADEAFTVGTAVVVSPIGSISFKGDVKSWDFPEGAGPATKTVYETLTGIQTGTLPDPYGWTVYLD